MERERPLIVCLTPVKDEAWILARFLRCAAAWADHIIIADQGSIDESRAIAENCAKAKVIENPVDGYDEGARQRLLIDAARRVPSDGHRIFIALDADEALSANWRKSPEWRQLLQAAPGTVLAFRWVNLLPGSRRGWFSNEPIPFGFVDDGTPHWGESIHSRRLPTPAGAPWMVFEDIKILHYQYIDWARMKSKQRWYQCWERIHNPEKRAVTIFRQYHHMDAAKHQAIEIDPAWLEEYEEHDSSTPEVESASHYRWDDDVLALLSARGVGPFRKLNIWDVDWADIDNKKLPASSAEIRDPRSLIDKMIHNWLTRTQPRMNRIDVRVVQRLLKFVGW